MEVFVFDDSLGAEGASGSQTPVVNWTALVGFPFKSSKDVQTLQKKTFFSYKLKI